MRKGQRKDIKDYKVDATKFININDPISAYILGLIWADGYIRNRGRQYEITFSTTYPDADYFLNIFKSNGDWNFYNRVPKNTNWKTSCNLYTSNRYLFEFLNDKDYREKSYISANKILELIPDNLKRYWFLGYLDGDGSIKCVKNNYSVIFTSSIRQDWKFLELLCQSLKIKYFLGKRKSYTGEYSILGIFNRSDCLNLLDYLYHDYGINNIGLPRKYEKYLSMLEKEKNGRNPRYMGCS